MTRKQVRFVYQTGLKRSLFTNARLLGTWDAAGRPSPLWSELPMTETIAADGCPAFTATVDLDTDDGGTLFAWSVRLDGPQGPNQWGILTEVNALNSNDRILQFRLDPAASDASEQVYRLNLSRFLGANKRYRADGTVAIQFRVWAPNARAVETVIGHTWRHGDSAQRSLESEPPGRDSRSVPPGEIHGGYIADDGTGVHPRIGPFPMTLEGDGIWATDPDDPRLAKFADLDHLPYMFRVTKDDADIPCYRTDLYARCQIGAGAYQPGGAPYTGRLVDLDGVGGCSAVVDPDRIAAEFDEGIYPETHWTTEADFWSSEFDPAKPLPQRLDDLVIYELHLGALGFGDDAQGTIEDAIGLLDYIEELGVNAIELLPLAEFGGPGYNWGYATSHYFAVEYGGGGRDKFKYLIRECHRRGIAVIMDVVYNHYVHDGERAQWMYDTNDHARNPYFWYEGTPQSYPDFDRAVSLERRGTGGYLDNLSTGWAPRYHETLVRKMFASMALALQEEFHIDGFRVDQTTSIHAYNVRHADGAVAGDANVFGAKTLREWSRTQKFIRPGVYLMAEDHSGWDQVTAPTDANGLGFDATWYADFYHHLVGDGEGRDSHAKLLKYAGYGDDRPLAMDTFAAVLAATGHNKVVYCESHDEAGNGSGTARNIVVAVNGAPLTGETRRHAEARCRFVFGVTVFSAGVPMFLFGEEVGAQQPLLYDEILAHKIDLRGERQQAGRGMFNFYRDAIALRRANPGLRSRQIEIIHVHNANRVIAFRRWSEEQELLVVASLNNHPFLQGYELPDDRLGGAAWREVFSSDASVFGGNGVGNAGALVHPGGGHLAVVIPANAVVVFARE
ncbi:MAG: alpha-amylase family glycosyl hydrolase [Candidatus Accumulibacter sp. UW26]|jgi:1,4-alpha-glucan branching enzyme